MPVKRYNGSAWETISGAGSAGAPGAAGTNGTNGGATLLSTTTLSGSSVNIGISSQSYRDLLVVISGVTNATATGSFRIAPNGTTNITHTQAQFFAQTSNPTTDSYLFVTDDSQKMLNSNANNVFSLTISQYSSTTTAKPFISFGYYYNNGMGSLGASSTSGAIGTTTAISSLVFSNTGGSFTAGTVKVYGVN